MLTAISPIDGRYASKTQALSTYFSEFALINYRVKVEILYFKALWALPLPQLSSLTAAQIEQVEKIYQDFTLEDAKAIKQIERTTNHDVKAVEYFIKNKLKAIGLNNQLEFIHFGLTSQDVNNTAIPMSLKDANEQVFFPLLNATIDQLEQLADEWRAIPMLARTHGQPASPTLLGKELQVFITRLKAAFAPLQQHTYMGKFGGATGNLNAHYVAFPTINWHSFSETFLTEQLGLQRAYPTTQIEHYDGLAKQFHNCMRINTILIDLCRDIWTYISQEYFKQKVIKGEVGSSAMPHKVNPIDFENAEGNLGLANASLGFLSSKLPISRLQRDLTDSTVLRNLGVPYGHMLIALQSIQKGLSKLQLNKAALEQDLAKNWMVVAEGIQVILRREQYPEPYEALKALTRGHHFITKEIIHAFIDELEVSDAIKTELKAISPENYVGKP